MSVIAIALPGGGGTMPEQYSTVDYHTGGEPFRIVTSLPVTIEGAGVPEKRVFAIQSPEIERIRQILCFEPRGHADMYGGFIVDPNDSGAHFGVLFWHKDGFSTACGHGTIALGVWAIESGLVAADPSGTTDVIIDVPSGRVTARVHTDGSTVTAVDFINVASYVLAERVPVSTSLGDVHEDAAAVIAIGREIKWALTANGTLARDATLVHDSIVGSRFTATVLEHVHIAGHDAVMPQVTGMAFKTGEHVFTVDPRDTLTPGFVLR